MPDYITIGGIVLNWAISAEGDASPRICGGNALFSAVGACTWSDSIGVVGRAPREFPEEFLSDFHEAGIDISGIRRLGSPHTRRTAFRYDEQGNRKRYHANEVIERWGDCDSATMEKYALSSDAPHDDEVSIIFDPIPDEIPPHYWQSKGFHVAPIGQKAEYAWINALNERSYFFTLDPGFNTSFNEYQELLMITPTFLPSEEDTLRLLGKIETDQALKRLAELGPRVVAIKLGRLGSVVYDARIDRQYHIPVYPTFAKDPTGAGDAYCGGFLVGWIETGDAVEAALRATISASFVVENFDARYALRFDRQDAEKRLHELRSLV